MNAAAKGKPAKTNVQNSWLPQEVVEKVAVEGKSLVQAWREYRHMSLQDFACRLRVTDSVCRVFERPNNILSSASLKKIAAVLEVTEDQLRM